MSGHTTSSLLELAVRMEAQLTAAGLATTSCNVSLQGQVSLKVQIQGSEDELDQALAVLGLSASLRSVLVYAPLGTRTVSWCDTVPSLGLDWLVVAAMRQATPEEIAEAESEDAQRAAGGAS